FQRGFGRTVASPAGDWRHRDKGTEIRGALVVPIGAQAHLARARFSTRGAISELHHKRQRQQRGRTYLSHAGRAKLRIRAGVGPFLEKRIRERLAWIQRKAFPTRGDKAVRAQSIRGRMELNGL